MSSRKTPNGELKELAHEPWPGYSEKFLIVFAVTVFWLLVIFAWGAYVGVEAGH